MASQSHSESETSSYNEADIERFISIIQKKFETKDLRYVGQSYNRVSFNDSHYVFYDLYPDPFNASAMLVYYIFNDHF